MTFVIPDRVLEELVCDSCFKYLLVKPVKVYPNRKIKCGRCSQEGDGGAISIFGLIPENSLFKCINRFDGCRQLLTCSQVAEHEKSCIGERYPCRICVEKSTTIPTYSLMKHFEYEHNRNILKWPMFVIPLDGSGDMFGSFLYEIEDTLYEIYFEVDFMRNLLVLGAESMSEDKRKTKQKFILRYGKEKIFTTKIKTCNSIYPFNKGFNIPVETFEKYPFINVEFEITPTREMFRLAEETSTLLESNQCATDEMSGEQEILFSVVTDNPEKIWQPRKVFLTERFRKSYPGLGLTSKDDGIRSLESNVDVFLHCRKCQGISQSADDYYRSFFYKDRSYYFVCYYCHQINKSLDTRKVKLNTFLDYSVYEEIEFFCSWNCGDSFNNENIIQHESQCSVQPFRDCPMKDCRHRATLREFEHHFQESHKPRSINGRKYSFAFVPNSLFSVKKSNYSSGLKKVFFVYYLWVLTVFVRVEVSWNDGYQTEFDVSFSACGDNRKNVRPKVLMFYNTTCKMFSKWSHVYPESNEETTANVF